MTTQMATDFPESRDLGYGQIFKIIWRRRYWFLITFLTVFSVGGVLAWQKDPTYESYLKILVEPNYQVNPNRSEISQLTENSVEVDYSTQLNLMRSSELLQKAVERLQADYPDLTVGKLRNNLRLERVEERDIETKLFQANYTAGDPLKTQNVLSAILSIYQEYNLEQQNQRLEEGLSFTNEQIAIARESLAQMETELEAFRTRHNLISPEVKAEALSTRLNAVEQQQEEVRASYEAKLAQYNSLQAQVKRSLPQAMNVARLSESGLYQNLLTQLQANQLALIEERTRFTEASPTIQTLREEREELLQLLEQEKNNLLTPESNSIGTDSQTEQVGSTELDLIGELVAIEAELASLASREETLAQIESQLRSNLNQFPTLLAQYDSMEQEIEVKRATLEQLLEARQELGIEINRGGFNWELVEPPLGGRKIAPNLEQDLLLGGVVALFLGGVAVYIRELLDNAIHSSEELQQTTSLPLLGVVPQWKPGVKEGFWSNLAFSSEVNSISNPGIFQWQPFRESVDLIYKNIQLLNPNAPPQLITVTSTLRGEGKSTLAIGFALSASRLGKRVLLIDSNLRQPELHNILNLPNQQGLTDFLQGRIDTPTIQSLTALDSQVDVLTAGSPIEDPVKLLSSWRMEELLNTYQQTYNLILMDTPAVLGVADTIHIASSTEAVVLVGRLEQIHQAELQQATGLLARLNLLGIIVNGIKDGSSGGYSASMLNLPEDSQTSSVSNSANGHNNALDV
ncbi:MAG: polysaccharide biosynthesis tyrosine autokinase [Halothece sp. Uz-M2-17]|nr:polysaccharide biosynthesis tyrosine autokinase [Halothece sp. Uz-M2-17]